MSLDIMAYIAPGVAELTLLIPLLFLPFAMILPTIAFWKICSKAGFSGAIGLLMLVPIANIILPLYLAFTEWPALKDTAQ
jgi:hypothetical protein